MRRLYTDKNGDLFLFESMAQVVEYIDPGKFQSRPQGFVGENLPTWDLVAKRTNREWAEGMHTLRRFTERLRQTELPEIKSRKRRVRFNEYEGDEVEYDRLMQGQPFWRKTEREQVEGPTTVTVMVDTSTPAYQSSDDILWRGAAALALTEILEEKGYSVELWVVNGSALYANESTRVMTGCCLKRCSDPLDTSTLINTVSGWFYRTVHFTLLRTICARVHKQISPALGRPIMPIPSDLDEISRDELRVYSAGTFSFEGALSVIQHELQNINERANKRPT